MLVEGVMAGVGVWNLVITAVKENGLLNWRGREMVDGVLGGGGREGGNDRGLCTLIPIPPLPVPPFYPSPLSLLLTLRIHSDTFE